VLKAGGRRRGGSVVLVYGSGRGHTDGVVLATEDEAAFGVYGGLVEVRVDVVLVVACRVHHVQRHV